MNSDTFSENDLKKKKKVLFNQLLQNLCKTVNAPLRSLRVET